MAGEKNFENRLKKWLESEGIYPLGEPVDRMSAPPCGFYEKRWGGSRYVKSGLPDMRITIASLTAHKKAIEDQEKEMKAKLYEAMVKFGVDKFESDVLNLTLVKPTNATSIDSAKLKKKYPDIASECSKTTAKAGYVKITLKDGGADGKG